MAIAYGKNPFLVCRLVSGLDIVGGQGVITTDTPLSCLNAATQTDCRLIILCFSTGPGSDLSDITVLCECLKSNPLTRHIPLFASVACFRRDSVARMKAAGVAFIGKRPAAVALDVEAIARRVNENDASCCIDRVLARLCPFLSYIPIDAQWEMIACRAYSNRLVLAGPRLREVCESEGHTRCEYHLHPRLKS